MMLQQHGKICLLFFKGIIMWRFDMMYACGMHVRRCVWCDDVIRWAIIDWNSWEQGSSFRGFVDSVPDGKCVNMYHTCTSIQMDPDETGRVSCYMGCLIDLLCFSLQ